MSPEDIRNKVERWRRNRNLFRTYNLLAYLTLAEFAQKTDSEVV